MAVLSSADLSYEIKYFGFMSGYVQAYHFFRWRGESLFNEDMLVRYHEGQPRGSLVSNEFEHSRLPSELQCFVRDEKENAGWSAYEKNLAVNALKQNQSVIFVAMVDAFNFRDTEGFANQGFAFRMNTSLVEMERFVRDLDRDYQEYRRVMNIDAWYKPEWSS